MSITRLLLTLVPKDGFKKNDIVSAYDQGWRSLVCSTADLYS